MNNTAAGLLREAVRALGSPPTPRRDTDPSPPAEVDDDPTSVAIADAALRQFELFGLARSTIEDIARRAKIGRVTLYRRFSNKDTLIEAVALRELRRFLKDLDRAVDPLGDPEEMIVEGFVFTLHAARTHRLLQRMIENEPETTLPLLTVQGAPIIAVASEYLASRMARDLDDDRGRSELLSTAEVVVRLIVSFLLTPKVTIDLEHTDQVRAFALHFLRPMLATPDGTLTLRKRKHP